MKLELFSDDLFIDQLVLDKSVPLQKEIWTPKDYNDSFKIISKNYPMHFHHHLSKNLLLEMKYQKVFLDTFLVFHNRKYLM